MSIFPDKWFFSNALGLVIGFLNNAHHLMLGLGGPVWNLFFCGVQVVNWHQYCKKPLWSCHPQQADCTLTSNTAICILQYFADKSYIYKYILRLYLLPLWSHPHPAGCTLTSNVFCANIFAHGWRITTHVFQIKSSLNPSRCKNGC